MGGKDLNLNDHGEILKIKSPKHSVGGPYVVVHADDKERWAIVAMKWGKNFRLGMRWFTKRKGYPNSWGRPTWFVVDPNLSKAILSGLQLDDKFRNKVEQFLDGNLPKEDYQVESWRLM